MPLGRGRCGPREAIFYMDRVGSSGLDPRTNAPGAGAITGDRADDGAFKSPSLRHIVESAPCMHDGRFDTLAEVVDHYRSGVQAHPSLEPRLRRNGAGALTDREAAQLVAFLEMLSDDGFRRDPRYMDLWLVEESRDHAVWSAPVFPTVEHSLSDALRLEALDPAILSENIFCESERHGVALGHAAGNTQSGSMGIAGHITGGQAPRDRLHGRDGRSGKNYLSCDALANQPGEPGAAASRRNQAERGLGECEACVGADDAQIAREGKLTPTCDGSALHCSDGNDWTVGNLRKDMLAEQVQCIERRGLLHRLEVGAATKCAVSCALNDHH